MSLFVLGFFNLYTLSSGIINYTKAQTSCIKIAINTQQKLNKILTQILDTNKTSRTLHRQRQSLKAYIKALYLSGVFIKLIPALKVKLKLVNLKQKKLLAKQLFLIQKANSIKRQSLGMLKRQLKLLKAKWIREDTFFKPALSLIKEKLGQDSYLYYPTTRFSLKQKITFSWKASPFFNVTKNINPFIKNYIKTTGLYHCSATLKKTQHKLDGSSNYQRRINMQRLLNQQGQIILETLFLICFAFAFMSFISIIETKVQKQMNEAQLSKQTYKKARSKR